MAAPGEGARGASPVPDDEHTFPHFPSTRSEAPGTAPSVVSSHMTDMLSDENAIAEVPGSTTSRAKRLSARSSQFGGMKPLRHGSIGRQPAAADAYGNTTVSYGGRPVSSASRSHVPSLTSHAFFHPMSSQKLQAQRGSATRPRTNHSGLPQTPQHTGESSGTAGATLTGTSQPSPPFGRPGSHGSGYTDQMTVDRITANTSPTGGFYAAASLTDSVRPLYQKNINSLASARSAAAGMAGMAGMASRKTAITGPKGLTIRVDKTLKSGNVENLPTPVRTPMSFRSSFMKAAGGDGPGVNRDIQGGEKLESVASTPQQSPSVASRPSNGTHVNAGSPTTGSARKSKTRSAGGQASGHPAKYSGKNYQFFMGNTIFFFGGRLENTRSRPINIATGGMIVIPSILFFVFSAPWLWDNVSPAVPVLFAYSFYICFSSFLHASLTDPGILPRNLHLFPPVDPNEDPLTLGPPTTDWALIKSVESSTAAMEVPVKYCRTCNIWRPPRTHHCRMCDNCIETADHHCVWLNNCVGRRNYRFFFTFVTSCTVLALFLMGASLAQLLVYSSRAGVSFGGAISHFRVPFAMFIYGILACSYPVPLVVYHLFLMGRGETTREFLNSHKFPKKDRFRAYTQANVVLNWIAVLCRPRPPTYYQFKGRHMEGDQRLALRPIKALRASALGTADKGGGLEMQNVTGFQGPVALRGVA